MPKKKRLSPDEDQLRRLHALGKKVHRALIKARGEKHTRYAPGAIVDLAQRMKAPASGLYKVAQFAALYADDELNQLCALKSKDGKRLGVGHVYELILVSKTSDRTKLQRQAASHGWSVRRLRAERRKRFPAAKKSRMVGRPPRIADVAGEILDQLRDEAWRWWRWIRACETRLDDREKQFPRQPALRKALSVTTSAIEGLLAQLSPAKPRTPAKRRRKPA